MPSESVRSLCGARTWGRGRASFEPLYREHYAFVWRCLRRFGVRGETEDALQEVFVTAYRRLHTFEARSSMRGWLAGIARRVAHRSRRTDARRQRRHQAVTRPQPTQDPEGCAARKQAGEFLERFLAGLDAEQRGVFVLCDIEGLRGREAASALGLNQNTAYSRLRSARTAFHAACSRRQTDAAGRRHMLAARPWPPHHGVQRGWAGFVAATTPAIAGLGRGTTLLGQAKLVGVTVALSGSVLAVLRVSVGTQPDPHTASSPQPQRAAIVVGEPSSPFPPRDAASVSRTAPDSTTSITSVPEIAAHTAPLQPPRRRQGRKPASLAAAPLPPPTPLAGLTRAEFELLHRARAALAGDDVGVAVALGREFVDTYPASGLAIDARGLLVRAHCRLGDAQAAATAGARLPATERARLLARYCDDAK